MASALRSYLAKYPVSKALGLKEGHFSFNSELGQCSKCEGKGVIEVEMHLMDDLVLKCEDCKGKRLKEFYADLSDGNYSVSQYYSYPMNQVVPSIRLTPKFMRIWENIKLLKLDHLGLDRKLNSLSGGEKQRLNLLTRVEKNLSNSLLIFENISSGLGLNELNELGLFFRKLADNKNTIVIIDANKYIGNFVDHSIDFKELLEISK